MAGCIACDANVLQRDQFARFCYESVRVTGDSASLTLPHTPTGRRPQASANRSAICCSLGALPQTSQPQEMPINAQCSAHVPCAISSCVGGCLPERVADTSEWQHCDAQSMQRTREQVASWNGANGNATDTLSCTIQRAPLSPVQRGAKRSQAGGTPWRTTCNRHLRTKTTGTDNSAVPPASTGNRFEGSPRHPHTVCISCMLKHVRPSARQAAASLHRLRSVHAARHRSGCSRARSQSLCVFVE
jgi:hypothetical protein